MVKIFSEEDNIDFPFKYNTDETNELKSLMENNSSITIDHLRRMALWKLNRVINISSETIEKLQKLVNDPNISIESKETEEVIHLLLQSPGVGMPMASTFLKFLRPDVFPIIDIRAYRAVYGKKISYSQYSYEIYKEYTYKLYAILEKQKKKNPSIQLCDIDEQLYCFDKAYNGKI